MGQNEGLARGFPFCNRFPGQNRPPGLTLLLTFMALENAFVPSKLLSLIILILGGFGYGTTEQFYPI